MNQRNTARFELRAEIPATLAAIDGFCINFRSWAEALALPAFFGPELMLREALTNAVVHGSHCNPSKRVLCISRWHAGRLVFAIRDEGIGFDWRTAWARQSVLKSCSGRGIELLRLYSTKVRFHDPGNSITILKRFDKEGS